VLFGCPAVQAQFLTGAPGVPGSRAATPEFEVKKPEFEVKKPEFEVKFFFGII